MVDQEPNRRFVSPILSPSMFVTKIHLEYISVQLIRRLDTRVPSPLLSSTLSSTTSGGLGKLADLRSPVSQWPKVQQRPAASALPNTGPTRGWTAIVAKPPVAPKPSTTPTPGLRALNASQSSRPSSSSSPAFGARPTPSIATPARVPTPTLVAEKKEQEHVPDNWEDDV